MCPKCSRVQFSLKHLRMCQVRQPLYCPNKCGATFYYGKGELLNVIKDMKYHSHQLCSALPQNKPKDQLLYLIHRPSQSLIYYTYNLLKAHGIIDKYTTWQRWNYELFNTIYWNKDHWIYLSWVDAMKDTCMNIPCDECQIKESERTRHNTKPKVYIQRSKQIKTDVYQRVIAQ